VLDELVDDVEREILQRRHVGRSGFSTSMAAHVNVGEYGDTTL
jgi:hypothetical protein